MKTRLKSFGIIFAVYAAAAVCGIAIYRALSLDFRIRLLIADACATVFVYIFSVIFRNASVYDPYWSVAPIVILTGFALTSRQTAYTVLLLSAVWIWGLRLTANWAYTFHGPKYEDWRYRMGENGPPLSGRQSLWDPSVSDPRGIRVHSPCGHCGERGEDGDSALLRLPLHLPLRGHSAGNRGL